MVCALLLSAIGIANAAVDCSEAYNGNPTVCERVECSDKFNVFSGTWTGPMESYDQKLRKYIPYTNTVSYSRSDCLNNTRTGEIFIIGRRTDKYSQIADENGQILRPEETKTGLLITGKNAAGQRFLRTVDEENGLVNYEHVFTDEAAELSIWQYNWPGNAKQLPMVFTVIDSRDLLLPEQVHKRFVTVTLAGQGWKVIGSKGYHTKITEH
jgi:hypothetical protein